MNRRQINQEFKKITQEIHNRSKVSPYPLEIVRKRELLLFAEAHLGNILEAKRKKQDIKNFFWSQLYIPTKRKGVWGDIDLIVYNKNNKVVAVISCKVSLHGRLTESLFYWLLFSTLKRPFKFVLATNDKGRGQGLWKSEWGSNEKPTKDRELAEKYTDGVYVKNSNTKLGGILKPIQDLAKDMIKWEKEYS